MNGHFESERDMPDGSPLARRIPNWVIKSQNRPPDKFRRWKKPETPRRWGACHKVRAAWAPVTRSAPPGRPLRPHPLPTPFFPFRKARVPETTYPVRSTCTISAPANFSQLDSWFFKIHYQPRWRWRPEWFPFYILTLRVESYLEFFPATIILFCPDYTFIE